MEIIFDGWTTILAATALAGTILTLIILVMEKYKSGHKVDAKFRWLLWVSSEKTKTLSVTNIFLIIIYEILFGIEIITSACALIINDNNEIIELSSWCGIAMYLYVLFLVIYIIISSNKYKNRIKVVMKVFEKGVFQRMHESIKVGGGGAMKPMLNGMLLLSALLLFLRIKQVYIKLSNGEIKLSFFVSIVIILAIMLWIVLIKSEKLQSMTIDKGELRYRNWYGKLDHCAIDEIRRIEENGAYIFFFRSEKEIFAKFNVFTKGLDRLLEDDG